MALLFLKNVVFPRIDASRDASRTTSYSPVSETHTNHARRQSSTSSSSSSVESLEDYASADLEKGRNTYPYESPAYPLEGPQSTNSTFTNRLISDATIGLSDGLTVPFALTAGLSALGSSRVVVYGGLAELIAGAISMGLGGYLGARSEAESYTATLQSIRSTIVSSPSETYSMLHSTLSSLRLPPSLLTPLLTHLASDHALTTTFLMTFHHNLPPSPPSPSAAYMSGLTISLGYFCGGAVPLLPYLFFEQVGEAFRASVAVMVVALFAFGWVKERVVDGERSVARCVRSGIQMVVMGGLAAGAAMVCVRVLSGEGGVGEDGT